MSIRAQLEKKIQAKTQEISQLETQIKEARAYVLGLQEAIKLLPREGAEDASADHIFRKGSDMDRTRELLRKAGKPLYLDDILRGIGKTNTRSLRRSLSSSLNVYVNKGEVFIRPKPNTYGLIGMELEEGDNDSEEEPPEGFGLLEPNANGEGDKDDDDVPW